MGDLIKTWTPRDILGADLPAHYPVCPEEWSE